MALALLLGLAPTAFPADPETQDAAPPAAQESEAPVARKVVPVVSAWLLGGREFAPGSPSKTTGMANILAAFSIPVSEKWKVLPSYQGYYQATQQVLEVGGRTTLFQARIDQRLSSKWILEPPGSQQRLKLSAAARVQLLQEAKDEPLGRGLFDYQKYSLGYEWEHYYRKPYSFRLGYDVYAMVYPKYATLEARGAFQVAGKPIARELSGGRVLDSNNHSIFLALNGPLGSPAALWEASYRMTVQSFPEQLVVNALGQFDNKRRTDTVHEGDISLRGSFRPGIPQRLTAALRLVAAFSHSNQNNFNAFDGRYFSRYYDYREYRGGVQTSLFFKHPSPRLKSVQLSASFDWIRRDYPRRLIQDGLGNYRPEAMHTDDSYLNLTLNWPLIPHLGLISTIRRGQSTSNMNYEAFYRYRYTTSSYLMGLGYEF